MLLTDVSAPTTGTLARLSDPRVRQFYDADHLIAKLLKADARAPQPAPDCCTRSGVLWDLAAVYPPGAQWLGRLPTATVFNGPVIDVMDSIAQALGRK